MLNVLRKLQAPPNPQAAFARHLKAADAANAARIWPEAQAGYAGALAVDPLRADLWVQYGHVLKEQGRLDEAGAAYRQATLLEPTSAEAFEHLGFLSRQQGRSGKALEAFTAALALDPSRDTLAGEVGALGGVRPAPRTPPLFRDLDDLPVRSADGIERPAALKPSWLTELRAVPSRVNPGRPRDAVVFLHLHKTGGLTLDDVLARNFAAARTCPIKDDHLHLYGQTELDSFDFFSGHFDYGALRLLKRPARIVSVFRAPQARLISFYRFHAGHDLGGRHGVNAFAQMANEMSAEEFFEDPRVRQAPEVFNHYLTVFGLTYHQVLADRPVTMDRVSPAVIDKAVARVRALDGIGLLERFDESVALVCATLGLQPPGRVKAINQTDSLSARMKGEPPPRVTVTPRLAAALADLTGVDDLIYAAARDEFERRYRAFQPLSPTGTGGEP